MKPSKNLYGITHDPSGAPRIVEPKTVKVGIGLAKGKAVHVYIDLEKKWVIQSGYGDKIVRERFADKAQAQMRYLELRRDAPERKYPERLSYFTFSHVSASGDMEPDWDVIETHGPLPTEIDIIFVRDDPFSASYQFWTAAEKKCDGDGKVALRVNSMAETEAERSLAAQAEKNGEKQFPIVNGCWLAGCKYSKPGNDRPAPCRPIGRLAFQLLKSPRLGGTAVFNTAGYKSISQIFSSIEIFKRATGRGDPEHGFVAGIPLKMVLRPYRINHNGRPTIQYAVGLEFRADSALALKQTLVEQAVQYRIAGVEPLKQLEGMEIRPPSLPDVPEPEENPATIMAEFDPTSDPDPEPPLDPIGIPETACAEPGGGLEHAWDDSAPGSEPAGAPPSAPLSRAPSAAVKKFYDLCRQRGMTDAIILNKLGSLGFENIEEITKSEMPNLLVWANSYKTQQGSLL